MKNRYGENINVGPTDEQLANSDEWQVGGANFRKDMAQCDFIHDQQKAAILEHAVSSRVIEEISVFNNGEREVYRINRYVNKLGEDMPHLDLVTALDPDIDPDIWGEVVGVAGFDICTRWIDEWMIGREDDIEYHVRF